MHVSVIAPTDLLVTQTIPDQLFHHLLKQPKIQVVRDGYLLFYLDLFDNWMTPDPDPIKELDRVSLFNQDYRLKSFDETYRGYLHYLEHHYPNEKSMILDILNVYKTYSPSYITWIYPSSLFYVVAPGVLSCPNDKSDWS